jgi:aminopeptidase
MAKGANISVIHEDVMVGAEDMDIVGITYDGQEVQIFKDGEWVF